MTRLRVLQSSELWEGEMSPVQVSGQHVVVIRLPNGLVAYEDRCPHLGVPLSRGRLEGEVLTCFAHHYTYDVKTGCGVNPCNVQLKPVGVSETNGHIFVDLEGRF